MPLESGQVLNSRYRMVKLLGQGGFGAVYRAWDLNLGRPCAIKENLVTSQEAQRQFKREAQILSNLSHPNLPRVTDHFVLPGQGQYLVMDFVEGEDLYTMLQRIGGPLAEAQALTWVSQVCDALTYLHRHNPPVVHRDIKPANIKITPAGEAILVDFGIAKIYDPHLNTTVGARAVTVGYSPQEQYGQGITDARSDIYALGATLYTLLTGQQPTESIQRSLGKSMPLPRALNPNLSTGAEQAILRAMELLPGNRFQSAAQFKAALQGTVLPPRVMPTARVAEAQPALAAEAASPRQVPWGWVGVGAAALVLLFCLVAFLAASKLWPDSGRTTEVAVITATSPGGPATEQTDGKRPTTAASPTSVSPGTELPPPLNPATDTPSPTFMPTLTFTPEQGGSGQARTNPADGAQAVFIPAGEFSMGLTDEQIKFLLSQCKTCKSSSFEASKPVHTVYLEAYWIYQTEVTNAMYAGCVGAGVCREPAKRQSSTRSSYFGNPEYNNYPVVFVDWSAADTYCRWAGGRLPTEAEWEKAARGPDNRLFPWGNDFPTKKLANVGQLFGDTTSVGSFPKGASPYGLFDMAGNVYEWVSDWYSLSYYQESPYQNPQGPAGAVGEPRRSVRGGNWYWNGSIATTSYHDWWEPYQSGWDVGFRCVLD